MTNAYDIAVVGMAGAFPGAADLPAFWRHMMAGQNAAAPVKADRWGMDPQCMVQTEPAPDMAYCDVTCTLPAIEWCFDGLRVDRDEIEHLDPLHHLVLHVGREATAGLNIGADQRRRAGVLLAAIALPTDAASVLARRLIAGAYTDSVQAAADSQPPRLSRAQCLAARMTGMPALLLARALGFGGMSYTLDAACASSLVAVKLACDALTAMRADVMLAGGVSRPDNLYTQVGFSQLRALSPSGRCAPFDAAADGLVVGEGAGMLVLKRLPDALKGGDRVYGIVRAVGLANDFGRNLLAPQSEGQVRAMQNAYTAAGWRPGDIEYIECHGAGTPRGDRTEISSMNQLWRAPDRRKGRCPIGSVKSMVGHLLTAAGAAGMIKTLLALQHHMLPPSLHFSAPGPDSPLTDSPFSVVTAPLPWEQRDDGPPRRCAVNAFGFGGINAHLLLESADALHTPGLLKRATPAAAAAVDASESTPESDSADEPAAVVGMAVAAGPIRSLSAFYQAVLNGTPAAAARHPECTAALQPLADTYFNGALPKGAYIEALEFRPGDFRLSPREMQATLPQHLLMLQTAQAALQDAGIDLSQPQPRTAVIIGAEFDFNATDHTVRWHLDPRRTQISGAKTDVEKRLRVALGPPLTADRTLGSLTGVIASRIAKTFQLGGASFVVSGDTLSGPAAIDAALHLLRRREVDRVLVGAVDIMGDIRRLILQHQITPFSDPGPSAAAARVQKGHWPGDGAAALVLERRCDALDQDLDYYADIHYADLSLAGDPDARPADAADRQRSFGRLLQAVKTSSDGLDFLEIQTPDPPGTDALDSAAVPSVFLDPLRPAAVGAVDTVIGFCGAAAGMMSVVKACLLLSHGAIPPTMTPQRHRAGAVDGRRTNRPYRNAAVAALSADGGAAGIGLSAPPADHAKNVSASSQDSVPATMPQAADTVIIPVSAKIPLPAPAAPLRLTPAAWTAPDVPLQDELVQAAARGMEQTSGAHQAFLRFTKKISGTYAQAFELQNRLLTASIQQNLPPSQEDPAGLRTVAFSREACLEFAVGKAANVLGPMFAAVDTYPARVRLPDEPLMLVDRILSVEGRKGSLQSGRIVTEHDVRPDAWYLDGGRAPVCIAVEAGQADLFLCAYLGIDLAVKGQRTYRLLDATVTFFGGLPCPGDILRYEIEIEKFIRQGQTYLFLFHFDGFIGEERFMQMRHGCAGFFTEKEVRESGGILARDLEQCPARAGRPLEGGFPVPVEKERYDDAALQQLRQGDLAACFGPAFQGKKLAASLRLPDGRMHLIDRVRELDPKGGRYGNGRIRAEADIHPDDWFLTCHFVDDPVMPGTLMYECCAHTLRVFLQRIGWISDRSDVCYAPVPGAASVLKCRGPVTPKTRKVVYEIDIRELGYNPAPYALADAHMYADGRRIVYFQDMSMQVSGLSQEVLADYWRRPGKTIHAETAAAAPSLPPAAAADRQPPAKRFNRRHMETFAGGLPSEAFGAPYRPFDRDRFIARLPRPPYLFLDRISRLEPEAWVLKPDGWIEAQYDVNPQDWYFSAAGISLMPFCVLNELALQPCGWLAAYMGSALQSQKDLHFRNLDGRADILGDVTPRSALIRMRARLTGVSEAGGMIIETFDFDIRGPEGPLYQGATRFGFFTHAALAQQKGITTVDENLRADGGDGPSTQTPQDIRGMAALSPAGAVSGAPGARDADIPDLLMIDRIDRYLPRGGPAKLGCVKGSRAVHPADWFFKAHFFQDPVCPGSLGLESLMQLLRFLALQRWPDLRHTAGFSHRTGETHRWTYRGQITPQNRRITVEAFVTRMIEKPDPVIFADGLVWVDGLCIYHIQNLGLRVKLV